MCLSAISPLAGALSGKSSGLAMMSPALAIGKSLFGKKKPDRQQILYPAGG
jgi:hypothetical protein